MAEDASLKTLNEKLFQKTQLRTSLVELRDDFQSLVNEKNAEIAALDTLISELQTAIGAVHPAPTLASVAPTYFSRGSGNTAITLTGTGFVSGSTQVYVNGVAVSTTYTSSTVVSATVGSANLTGTGTVLVFVRTGTPGGGSSNTLSIPVINGAPTINTLTPNTISAGAPATQISVTGTNLYNNSTVYINGVPATTTLSGSNLLATIPASALGVPGYVSVYVVSPTPGGGQSEQLLFTVT